MYGGSPLNIGFDMGAMEPLALIATGSALMAYAESFASAAMLLRQLCQERAAVSQTDKRMSAAGNGPRGAYTPGFVFAFGSKSL